MKTIHEHNINNLVHKAPNASYLSEILQELHILRSQVKILKENCGIEIGEILNTLNHARIFITSREKMHRDGVVLYDDLIDKLRERYYTVR